MSRQTDRGLQGTSKDRIPGQLLMKDEMAMNCHQLEEIQLKSNEEIAKEMQLQYDEANIFNTDSSEDEFEDMSDEESEEFYTILKRYDAVPAFNYRFHNRRKVCENIAGLGIKQYNRTLNRYQARLQQKEPAKQEMYEKHINVSYGVDEIMRRILYRMMDQKILEQVTNVIYFGKKSVILHVRTNPQNQLPSECAIMMFKSALPEHNNLGRRAVQKLTRSFAEKELQHLERLRRAGVLCPTVFGLKSSALMISFLGRNSKQAPNLKDAPISEVKMTVAYSQVVHYMQVMYNECKLIHGDLSEYNILWFDNNCYIVNVFQCVEATHETAFRLLYKGCENISKFFRKLSVPNIATPDQLFKDITNCEYADVNPKKKKTSQDKKE